MIGAVLRRLHGRRGTRAARRTERRLRRWRSLYHCTQSEVVNCIRDATRIYGGSFAQNLACAKSESGLDPYAHNSGGSGATGLYQFMPATWSRTLARMRASAGEVDLLRQVAGPRRRVEVPPRRLRRMDRRRLLAAPPATRQTPGAAPGVRR
jgi:hypothetical protein